MLNFNGDPDTTETERFVRMLDQFFDCLNVRSPNEHVTKRKPNLKPYTSGSDERLCVSLVQIHKAMCVNTVFSFVVVKEGLFRVFRRMGKKCKW